MGRIEEYDKKRTRLLILILPIALCVILLILLTMEKTNVVKRYFTVGYKGPMKVLPEIQIVDEIGLEDVANKRRNKTLIAQNIKIEGEEIEEKKEGEKPEATKKKEGEINLKEKSISNDFYRSYASKANVPYREDYVILKMVKPEYPQDALDLGLEGYVLVELYINTEGKVAEAWVRSSYGPLSFEESALKAVKQFVFQPVKENGKPIPFWVSFLIKFKLKY